MSRPIPDGLTLLTDFSIECLQDTTIGKYHCHILIFYKLFSSIKCVSASVEQFSLGYCKRFWNDALSDALNCVSCASVVVQ